MLATPLMLAFVAVAATLQQPATGTVRGRVVSETADAPLAFALVEVLDAGRPLGALADSTGAYVLRDVPAGRRRLRVGSVGYASLEVEVLVPAGREIVLGLALATLPILMPPIVAHADPAGQPTDSIPASAPALAAAAVRALDATPGMVELGLTGPGGAGGGSPGQDPVDPSDVLFVRGSAADLKLVLLDGAPVYTPFHLGGLLPSFEPELLRSATLYGGGAPARYDGGLSYILDLRTRAGKRDAVHGSAGVDLLSGEARLEGPFGPRGGFLAAARGVHPLAGGLLTSRSFPYAYADGMLRLDTNVGREGVLAATAFWNQESVALDEAGGAGTRARWGNAAASLRYQGPLAGAAAKLTAGVGRFHGRLPIGGSQPFTADGIAERVRVAADFARPAGPAQLHFGAAYEHLRLHYQGWTRGGVVDALLGEVRAAGAAAGVHVEAAWQAGPRVRLRGGMRADVFSLDDGLRFGPRAAATWLISERAALTLAAGRYHQYVRAPERTLATATAGLVSLAAEPPPLTIAGASHVILTLDQQLGDDVRLGLEGFFKRFDGIPVADQAEAQAQASGVDVWLRHSGRTVTLWAGYSLTWVWSVAAEPAGTGGPATDLFYGRQLLSAGLTGPLGSVGGWDVRLAYGAGLPYTAVPSLEAAPAGVIAQAATPPNRAMLDAATADMPPLTAQRPEQPYLRLDAELHGTWTPTWGGTTFRVMPYVKVLNALDQRDALFYHFDPARDAEPRPLGKLPVLPVVGVRWQF